MAVDPRSSTAASARGGVCRPEVGAAPVARSPRRRGDSGLTTLEWLLIVAAVAGLAALAVVLVQNVVSDTSEQIAGSSARVTAAQLAAAEIMREAASDVPVGDSNSTPVQKPAKDWISKYQAQCERLRITYGDAGIQVTASFVSSGAAPADGVAWGMASATAVTGPAIAAAAMGLAANCIVTSS